MYRSLRHHKFWFGALASSAEQKSNGGGSLVGMLVVAVVDQVANTVMDKGHDIAGITSARLLNANMPNGILYGPHSPKYNTQK
ncbi:MAG: GNA1162 family protein [Aeromonas sp.]|uniref:GNA1162 family protein n=1 Tax=Aeromonas sp. TaxID=647 RepID=UPI003D6B90BC